MCLCSIVWFVGFSVSGSILNGSGLGGFCDSKDDIGCFVSKLIFSVCWMCWLLVGFSCVVVIGFSVVRCVCMVGMLICVVFLFSCVCNVGLVCGSLFSLLCSILKYSIVLFISKGSLLCDVIFSVSCSVFWWNCMVE